VAVVVGRLMLMALFWNASEVVRLRRDDGLDEDRRPTADGDGNAKRGRDDARHRRLDRDNMLIIV